MRRRGACNDYKRRKPTRRPVIKGLRNDRDRNRREIRFAETDVNRQMYVNKVSVLDGHFGVCAWYAGAIRRGNG
jgi:hypothetical protein